MAIQQPLPKFTLYDNNGEPANGWKVHTYEPGTTTNKATYTDSAEGSANTNPVILNARGEADIWFSGLYKVVVKDADDNTIYTVDNYGSTGVEVFTNTVTFAKGADIASASALTLGADGNYFDVSGTTAITSINTVGAGTVIKLHFDGVLTFTHHATNLILPGGVDITTAAGDEAELVEYSTGAWRLTNYLHSGVSEKQVSGDYIKLSDVKAAGIDGGTFTAGAWQTRDLNTEDADTGNHCTLSSNQFTLDAGTYYIRASAPVYEVNTHKIRLQNITDTTTPIIGQAAYAESIGVGNHAFLQGQITFTSAKTFEIQHHSQATKADNGFGVDDLGSVDAVFTVVELWKVS